MKKPLALDLFCKAGGASMGLAMAGFEVIGVDIEPQPRYPFRFIQADALKAPLNLGSFDLIWASPPCQAYSKTRAIWKRPHPELVEPTRKILIESGRLWVIENVVGAPLIDPIRLCGLMFGLRVLRHRLFESNFHIPEPPHAKHSGTTNAHRGMSTGGDYICVAGHNFLVSEASEAMGIDWMNQRELANAVPPAYAEHIGRYAIKL